MKAWTLGGYMTTDQFLYELRRHVEASGQQRKYAKSVGISHQHLNDILHGRRLPSEEVARRMGFERRTVFIPCEGGKS